jgi:hypothetical protein
MSRLKSRVDTSVEESINNDIIRAECFQELFGPEIGAICMAFAYACSNDDDPVLSTVQRKVALERNFNIARINYDLIIDVINHLVTPTPRINEDMGKVLKRIKGKTARLFLKPPIKTRMERDARTQIKTAVVKRYRELNQDITADIFNRGFNTTSSFSPWQLQNFFGNKNGTTSALVLPTSIYGVSKPSTKPGQAITRPTGRTTGRAVDGTSGYRVDLPDPFHLRCGRTLGKPRGATPMRDPTLGETFGIHLASILASAYQHPIRVHSVSNSNSNSNSTYLRHSRGRRSARRRRSSSRRDRVRRKSRKYSRRHTRKKTRRRSWR